MEGIHFTYSIFLISECNCKAYGSIGCDLNNILPYWIYNDPNNLIKCPCDNDGKCFCTDNYINDKCDECAEGYSCGGGGDLGGPGGPGVPWKRAPTVSKIPVFIFIFLLYISKSILRLM